MLDDRKIRRRQAIKANTATNTVLGERDFRKPLNSPAEEPLNSPAEELQMPLFNALMRFPSNG
ncbi:MAG: hypothetical protein P1U77_14215 [Rubripirellula sp.]|nr:hypothetical protein [Rubripirellula sp.]